MRTLALLALLFVGLMAVGIGLFIATQPPSAAVRPPQLDGLAGARPWGPPAFGPGRGVDDLLKNLDLMRPARVTAADDFRVPLLDGRPFRLAEQRGKMVFVNFWATWCPPCRAEMPAMERLWRKHKDSSPFVMLAISLDADPKLVAPFVKEHGFTFPVALDPKQEVGQVYAVRALPSTFIVDRDGSLTAVAIGPRAWDGATSDALVQAMVR